MKHVYPAKAINEGSVNEANPYFEFLSHPALSAGIYVLKTGEQDLQKPHSQDEVYYVLEGQSQMVIGSSNYFVTKGDLIYVPAFAEHRFYDIDEDLKLLVFFSNAGISTPL